MSPSYDPKFRPGENGGDYVARRAQEIAAQRSHVAPEPPYRETPAIRQDRLERERKEAEVRRVAELQRLCSAFYDWALRNNIPPNISNDKRWLLRKEGWVVAEWSRAYKGTQNGPGGIDEGWSSVTRRSLVVTTKGELMRYCGPRSMLEVNDWSIFTVEDIYEHIARFVADNPSARWP